MARNSIVLVNEWSRWRKQAAIGGAGLLLLGIATYFLDASGPTRVPPSGFGIDATAANVATLRRSFALGLRSPTLPYKSPPFDSLRLVFQQGAGSEPLRGSLTGVLIEDDKDARAELVLVLPQTARNITDASGPAVRITKGRRATHVSMFDAVPFGVVSRVVSITLDSRAARQRPTITSAAGHTLVDIRFELPKETSRGSPIHKRLMSVAYFPTHPILHLENARPLTAENTYHDFPGPRIEMRVARSTEEFAAVSPPSEENTFGTTTWLVDTGLATRQFAVLIVDRRSRTAVQLLEALTFLGAGVLLGAFASSGEPPLRKR